jgi:hypothetical protein
MIFLQDLEHWLVFVLVMILFFYGITHWGGDFF